MNQHSSQGGGIGYSIHTGQIIVAGGPEAAVRHADADYPEATAFVKKHGIKIPMGFFQSLSRVISEKRTQISEAGGRKEEAPIYD